MSSDLSNQLPSEGGISEALIDEEDEEHYFDRDTNNENEEETNNENKYDVTIAKSGSINISPTNGCVFDLLNNSRDANNEKIFHLTTVAKQLDEKNPDISPTYNNILQRTWNELIPRLSQRARKLFFSYKDTSRQFIIFDKTGTVPYGFAESLDGRVNGRKSGPNAEDSLAGMIGKPHAGYPLSGKFPKGGLVVKERFLVKEVTDEKMSEEEIQAFKVKAAKNAKAFEEAKSLPENTGGFSNGQVPTLWYVYASTEQGTIGELIAVFTKLNLAQRLVGSMNSGDTKDKLAGYNTNFEFGVARKWKWTSRGEIKGEWWIKKEKGTEKDIPSGLIVAVNPESF